MNRDFETSWINHFNKISDKRNRTVALIALITGTILIIPDVLFNENYSLSLLIIRIAASTIGFIGFVLFTLKAIKNSHMVLFYALPVFSVSAYMVALQSTTEAITQMNNTIAIVGMFFVVMFILKTSTWIIICSVMYVSYFLTIAMIGHFPFKDYFIHGGSLTLIGFATFPFITRVRHNMQRENFNLNFEVECQKEELEYYANNDLLTGAFNRRGGMKILEKAISMSERHNIPLSISFIDINGLKKVNDKYGHTMGDLLIKTISTLIKENIRKSDSLFRFGGDEFIIVFPGCSLEENKKIMLKILNAAVNFKSDETSKINVSFSHGLSEYKNGMSIDDFIKSADKEMYINKN